MHWPNLLHSVHLIGRSVGQYPDNQKQDKLKLCYHPIYSAGRQLLRLSVHYVVVPVGIKTRGTSVICYVGCSLYSCTFLVRCFVAVEMKAAALVEKVSSFGKPLTAKYCVMSHFLRIQRGLNSRPKPIAQGGKPPTGAPSCVNLFSVQSPRTVYKKRDLFTDVSIRSRPLTTQ